MVRDLLKFFQNITYPFVLRGFIYVGRCIYTWFFALNG